MPKIAEGVLPDEVIRDPRSTSSFVFVDLASDATRDLVQDFLQHATKAVEVLKAAAGPSGARYATVAVSVGRPLLAKAQLQPDFMPTGFAELPATAGVSPDEHDFLFYIMSSSDSVVADFLRALRAGGAASVRVERGYQRDGGREPLGSRDGLRNVSSEEREEVAFIGERLQPDEPRWAAGASYLAFMKIRLDLDRWNALGVAEQERAVGRRMDDGSRLDLPAGTPVDQEGAFSDAAIPAPDSHVRKSGPRGADQDRVQIFRRGTPYIETSEDGHLEEGLLFASFQADLTAFDTVFNAWMLNAGFPNASAGPDALFVPGAPLATVLTAGFYLTLPPDRRYLGAAMFDADSRRTSHIVIRKRVVDGSGARVPGAQVEGAHFQVTNTAGDVLGTAATDAAGRAVIEGLPVGVPLTLTETAAPAGSQVGGPHTFQLDCHPQVIRVDNTRVAPPTQYGA